jgi:3-phenylpropionate/trans-cinnamate dioxygenase ferredoxin reductase subunit
MVKYIVVGASHAGVQAAFALRSANAQSEITLFSGESHIPYHRPPLSKTYLSQDIALQAIQLKPEQAYQDQNIALHLATPITRIDLQQQQIESVHGNVYDYDVLILATGGNARRIAISGLKDEDIDYLRDANDADKIKRNINKIEHICLIGGGYIGLELAASLRQLNKRVTIIESAPRVLNRVVCAQMSEFYQTYHHQNGVDIRLNTQIKSGVFEGGRYALVDNHNQTIHCDMLIAGIGLEPSSQLALKAGIKCNNGIVINKYCQTNAANVYAIGDCTYSSEPESNYLPRVESIGNAQAQAKIAVHHICGLPSPKPELPWFWSDQYKLKLKMVGISADFDNIVLRGDPKSERFSCFYLANQQVIAVDTVNQSAEFMAAKQLISNKYTVNAEQLKNPKISIKEIIEQCQKSFS